MTWIEENLDTHKEDRGDVDRSMRGGRKEREKKEKSFSSAEDREKNTLKNKPIQ